MIVISEVLLNVSRSNFTVAVSGCNLFPDTNCPSHFGKKHIQPRSLRELCDEDSMYNEMACSLPELLEKGQCRACLRNDFGNEIDETKWRCDDGTCINKNDTKNGILNCPDGSDELRSEFNFFDTNYYRKISQSIYFIVFQLTTNGGTFC